MIHGIKLEHQFLEQLVTRRVGTQVRLTINNIYMYMCLCIFGDTCCSLCRSDWLGLAPPGSAPEMFLAIPDSYAIFPAFNAER